jgi:hypothetical protein
MSFGARSAAEFETANAVHRNAAIDAVARPAWSQRTTSGQSANAGWAAMVFAKDGVGREGRTFHGEGAAAGDFHGADFRRRRPREGVRQTTDRIADAEQDALRAFVDFRSGVVEGVDLQVAEDVEIGAEIRHVRARVRERPSRRGDRRACRGRGGTSSETTGLRRGCGIRDAIASRL